MGPRRRRAVATGVSAAGRPGGHAWDSSSVLPDRFAIRLSRGCRGPTCTARIDVEWFGEAGDKPGDQDALAALPSVEGMIARQSFSFFGEDVIVGTPEDARGMLADYVTRGRMTHLVLMTAMPGLAPQHVRDCMQLFARTVLPAFRGRA